MNQLYLTFDSYVKAQKILELHYKSDDAEVFIAHGRIILNETIHSLTKSFAS